MPTKPSTRIAVAKRRAQVVDLISAGATMREAAEKLKISKSRVHQLYREGVHELVDDQYGDRKATLGRLLRVHDLLIRGNLTRALGGDHGAARVVQRSATEIARLTGVAAPIRADVTIKSRMDDEIEELIRELEQAGQGHMPDLMQELPGADL